MRNIPTLSFVYAARATLLAAVTAATLVLGIGLARQPLLSSHYFWQNELGDRARLGLLGWVGAAVALSVLLALGAWLRLGPQRPVNALRVLRAVERASPLGPLCFVPCLMKWDVWQGHELGFLLAALLVSLAVGRTLALSLSASPEAAPSPLLRLCSFASSAAWKASRWRRVPSVAIVCATFVYIVWFAYHTSVWHLSARSGWDTSIEDSILWNTVFEGRFFAAPPALGPSGSHFRRHAALLVYVLAPFYALKPGAATVLVIGSVLQGLAALPLYLFARRRLGDVMAALVAFLYLWQPALQQSNLFEVHYVKFGPVFLWLTLWLLDSGRHRWALFASALTLLVREDVATWVMVLGAWGLFYGRSPRTSLLMLGLSTLYVGVIKFVAMPSLAGGGDELMFMYNELLPRGKASFAWVMATLVGNPFHVLESLFDFNKLIYFLQLLVPLALVPLRRTIGWLALIPSFVFSFLSTHYAPLVSIHFQYSAHALAFVFPSLVLVLEGYAKGPTASGFALLSGERSSHTAPLSERRAQTLGLLGSVVVATLVCSYQFGAVLQQHTSRGGPIPYRFGWDEAGRARRHSVDALLALVPPRGNITASAFTVTQVSARPNGYSLSLGLYDADWLIAPSELPEYVGDEAQRTAEALRSGEWGVVQVVPPFFLAKRGHSTELNHSILSKLPPR